MNRWKQITLELFKKWDCELLETNGESDHVDLLFDAPPQNNLANTINRYKTVTSRNVRKEFPKELEKYYWKSYFWSRSYMILTTRGSTIDVIKKYRKAR